MNTLADHFVNLDFIRHFETILAALTHDAREIEEYEYVDDDELAEIASFIIEQTLCCDIVRHVNADKTVYTLDVYSTNDYVHNMTYVNMTAHCKYTRRYEINDVSVILQRIAEITLANR